MTVGVTVGVPPGAGPCAASGGLAATPADSGLPFSANPTPYPNTNAITRVMPMIARCVHGTLARSGSPLRMLMSLAPSLQLRLRQAVEVRHSNAPVVRRLLSQRAASRGQDTRRKRRKLSVGKLEGYYRLPVEAIVLYCLLPLR